MGLSCLSCECLINFGICFTSVLSNVHLYKISHIMKDLSSEMYLDYFPLISWIKIKRPVPGTVTWVEQSAVWEIKKKKNVCVCWVHTNEISPFVIKNKNDYKEKCVLHRHWINSGGIGQIRGSRSKRDDIETTVSRHMCANSFWNDCGYEWISAETTKDRTGGHPREEMV